ncbi:hypothetical protein DDQ41_12545 [Streptomyces spongiicola]|uniref:Uncharacterized protein n=1 Tax=Streptomyces spongiicola TaxID=1690221 RepID=A0ABN5KLW0_9ACTN|nr:hypothetical protein [Streptomyces spongiicola]AWK09615.1 hypothetical protein DDQ41_12545 [Streptomyces spongiicola]
MIRQLTADERRALTDRLAAHGITPRQFTQAQELARTMSETLARTYGEVIGRRVTPVEFITDVLGVEGAGRLVACALREITDRPDLYRDA